MATTVSVVNLKGGVGKTAIAVNFAAFCGENGFRTLLVDVDPQTNATFSMMDVESWKEHAASRGTVADLLGARTHTHADARDKTTLDVIAESVFDGVDLIPSHLELFTVDLDLAGAVARESRLRRALTDVREKYDIIVFDCPPNLTIPTQNALAASTHYVVPISPDYLSGIGVGILVTRVREYCKDLGHDLSLAGIVISRVGRHAIHRAQTVAALRQQFGDDVLRQQLKERVAVSESASRQHSVFNHQDGSAGAEFRAMSQELLRRIGIKHENA